MGISFMETFGAIYNRIPQAVNLIGGIPPEREMMLLLRQGAIQILLIILPILLIGFAVAFISDLWQVKWQPLPSIRY